MRPLLLVTLFCVAASGLSGQAPLPAIGIAVPDSARRWCAAFSSDSVNAAVVPGGQVTLVLPGDGARTSLAARVRARRSEQCPAAFAQPRWYDYTAYDLELVEIPDSATGLPPVVLVVADTATWTRGPDGLARADLDGDGYPEELRRCLAGEGEHLTIWSARPGSSHLRRWHEYFDWGAEVDPTCGPGEAGGG